MNDNHEVTLGEVSRDLTDLRREFGEFRKDQSRHLARLPDKEYLQLVVDTMQRNVDLQVAAARASADTQIILVRTESEGRDESIKQLIADNRSDIESLQGNNRWLVRLIAASLIVTALSVIFHVTASTPLAH